MKELIKKIETLSEDKKNLSQIERFVDALEEKNKLPQELQDKLSLIGNNPMKESKIAEVWKSVETDKELDEDDKIIAILDTIFAEGETTTLYEKGIGFGDFLKFGSMAKEKVMGFMEKANDETEVFKEVESHKELKPLSFATIKEIKKFRKTFLSKYTTYVAENQSFISRLQSGDEVKINIDEEKAKIETYAKEYHDSLEAMNNRALEMSGIRYDNQTDWEQKLLANKVIAMAMGTYTPTVGKN